jgi:serine/threonine protein kinase
VRDTNTQKMEEFTLLSTLGRGAQSVVHRARWHFNSQEVAIKFEPVSDTSQLLNEAYILTKLVGLPGVPGLLSYGITLDRSKYYSATNVLGIYTVYHTNTI